MGIGDVTLPLAPCVVEAVKKGVEEMGVKETFKGYEDSGTGYDFLKEAVSNYYKSFGVDVPADDIRSGNFKIPKKALLPNHTEDANTNGFNLEDRLSDFVEVTTDDGTVPF